MANAQSWSLWLVPEGELYQPLADTIARLADAYNAPRFEPHVTLAGVLTGTEADLRERSTRLAEVMEPCRIQLASPDYTDAYFQCLFLRVELTAELLEAHRRARIIFGMDSESDYIPHISLMYGNYPEEVKRGIITGLGDELQGAFTAEQFHLYNTNGPPPSWQLAETFPVR